MTVFRNIEYFRVFFGASYVDRASGKRGWPALHLLDADNMLVSQSPSLVSCMHRYWEETFGIWMAARHHDIAVLVDYSRQVSMSG